MSQYYCIIQNAHCAVRLGIHEFEKEGPQNILVSVKLSFPFSALQRIRHIGDTVDYEPLRNFIQSWSERPHIPLIEDLLDELVGHCFDDPRVDHVEATIRKTTIFDEVEEIGVGIDTSRQDWYALIARR
ncbi:MAG: dihydroneopterin aldolase [Betaproteobacteria bacterium]|nr:dihydroneopterin aldolase [Betaproteobacteria bacterium]